MLIPDNECHADLPARLAADLDGSFEALVHAYQHRLYAFAVRFTGSPPDAEEIAQDTFVRAYGALRNYPPERVRTLALRPWLYQIALNIARNRRRGQQLRVVPLDGGHDGNASAGAELAGDARDGPEALVERAELRDELGALVLGLPPRYRSAVILRHVAGLSYAEMATTLDQPVGTVKANVHRGIVLLRAALHAAGQTRAATGNTTGTTRTKLTVATHTRHTAR